MNNKKKIWFIVINLSEEVYLKVFQDMSRHGRPNVSCTKKGLGFVLIKISVKQQHKNVNFKVIDWTYHTCLQSKLFFKW